MTTTTPTITVAGHDYTLSDTGTAWVITDLGPLFQQIAAEVEWTYQRRAAIAAEDGHTLTITPVEVAIALATTDLAGMVEVGITTLRPDYAYAPYVGDGKGMTPQRLADALEHMLSRVSDWTVGLIARTGQPL
jgi:hypothetical protein